MNLFRILFFGAIGMALAWLLIPLIRKWAGRRKASTGGGMFHQAHTTPVPRFGGLALAMTLIVIAALSYIAFPPHSEVVQSRLVIILGSLAMFLIGFWDDLRPLGAKKKLIGQIVVALAVYAAGCQIEHFKNPFTGVVYQLGHFGLVATVLWLVALTNLINLVDGIDGLAGGLGLMMMVLLTYAAGGSESFPLCISAGMAGALIAFLRFNFPPARIYLGDGGAYMIGFMIGILTIENSHKGTVAAMLIAPLFALALPIADVTLAILRRGMKGLPIFRPDRRHLHHRLLATGFSHKQAVLILYGISLVFLLLSLGILWSQGRWLPISFGFLCLTFFISARSFKFSREWFSIRRVLDNTMEMRRESDYGLTLCRWLELEADRCKSFDDLWTEYGFVLRKLGFSRVKLSVNNGERVWQSGDAGNAVQIAHQCRHELRVGGKMVLEFFADDEMLNPQLFEHLSEIAAEGWHKAASKWQKAHERPLEFTFARERQIRPGRRVAAETEG
jgi:UDP-GlcNAc:undecaprenyl-phosphate/decaprenyl-phosphate GlcNAc-1-phosphate transferase